MVTLNSFNAFIGCSPSLLIIKIYLGYIDSLSHLPLTHLKANTILEFSYLLKLSQFLNILDSSISPIDYFSSLILFLELLLRGFWGRGTSLGIRLIIVPIINEKRERKKGTRKGEGRERETSPYSINHYFLKGELTNT